LQQFLFSYDLKNENNQNITSFVNNIGKDKKNFSLEMAEKVPENSYNYWMKPCHVYCFGLVEKNTTIHKYSIDIISVTSDFNEEQLKTFLEHLKYINSVFNGLEHVLKRFNQKQKINLSFPMTLKDKNLQLNQNNSWPKIIIEPQWKGNYEIIRGISNLFQEISSQQEDFLSRTPFKQEGLMVKL
jgi:hypothetical protein